MATKVIVFFALLLSLCRFSLAQSSTLITKLTQDVGSTIQTTVTVQSSSGFQPGTTYLYVDTEAMRVTSFSGNTVHVMRGVLGTEAQLHVSGNPVFAGPRYSTFVNNRLSGKCTADAYEPKINASLGKIFNCVSSIWLEKEAATIGAANFAGNVGIGTTEALSKLEVAGETAITAGTAGDSAVAGIHLGYVSNTGTLTSTSPGVGNKDLIIQGLNINLQANAALAVYIKNGGNVGIGTLTPSALFDVNSDILRLRTPKTPASASAACNAGDICWDANYLYVCVATDTWKRSALTTW